MINRHLRSLIILAILGLGVTLGFTSKQPANITENNCPSWFLDSADWGISPGRVMASKGRPKEPLLEPQMTVLPYPQNKYGFEGNLYYFFNEKGLYSRLYIYQIPPHTSGDVLFRRLESALACQFQSPGQRVGLGKKKVKLLQAVWENDETFASLFYINTLPEITITIMDKTAEINQYEPEAFRKMQEKIKNRNSQRSGPL